MMIYLAWYLVFLIIIFGIGIYGTIKFSLNTSRELRRLELITRSPLFSHLSNAMMGAKIIRIFENQEQFKQKFLNDAKLN